MTANQNARRPRHSVKLGASIARSCGVTSAGVVSDFSLDGCCVSGFFKVGEQLEMSISSIGTFSARVCWSRMGRAGVRFLRDIPAQFGKCERGTSTIEYAVLAAGVAVALVASLGGVGGKVGGTWNEVDSSVPGPTFTSGGAGGDGGNSAS